MGLTFVNIANVLFLLSFYCQYYLFIMIYGLAVKLQISLCVFSKIDNFNRKNTKSFENKKVYILYMFKWKYNYTSWIPKNNVHIEFEEKNKNKKLVYYIFLTKINIIF